MNDSVGRILGIGGIFFKAQNAEPLRAWYRDKLGIESTADGAMFNWTLNNTDYLTVWTIFPADSKYFEHGLMINYIVDDLDAFMAKLDGVRIDPKRDDHEYGRFAWIYDLEDKKIELWQPPKSDT